MTALHSPRCTSYSSQGTTYFAFGLKLQSFAVAMASAEEVFRSPESSSHHQVMSPTRSAAILEGETMGPSYGSADFHRVPTVLANGTPAVGGPVTDAATLAGQDDGGDTRGCGGAGPEEMQRSTGLGYRQRVTGLDGATHAVRTGSPYIGQPPLPMGTPQQQPPQLTTQPPQIHPVPPQLHQARQLASSHEHQTPPQQQQAHVMAPHLNTQAEQPQQATPTQPPQLATSSAPSPSQYPDPMLIPPPIQVMRSLTTQVTSAATAMGQRMQIHTLMSQGRASVQEGNGAGELDVGEGVGAFDLVSDPPPLPQHLRADALQDHSRVGIFAGLARAGQAFRRRIMEPVLHQVSRSPGQQVSQQPLLSGEAGPHELQDQREGGVFTPDMAEAMREWTQRPGPKCSRASSGQG